MELAQNNKTKWKGKHAVLAGSRSREEKNEGDAEFGEKAAYNGHYMLRGAGVQGKWQVFFSEMFSYKLDNFEDTTPILENETHSRVYLMN